MCTGYSGNTEQEMTHCRRAVGEGRFCSRGDARANFEAQAGVY